jgi:4-hydroxyproline epimerase
MATAQIPVRLDIVDSHTAGEPTRCVIAGLPDLGLGAGLGTLSDRDQGRDQLPDSLSVRLGRLRKDHDHLRRAILCEPRGSDVLVGAYLVEPVDPACVAGVIFFNNAGYLGMCGHGMIGVAVTLVHRGRIGVGEHWIETPVGAVQVKMQSANRVGIRNVPAYRYRTKVSVEVAGHGRVTGDVAWGGNWFFLAGEHGYRLSIDQVEPLTAFTWEVRCALAAAGITGANGAEIDHIELFSDALDAANHSRNFVLCPGKAYDRSPCGTGTSAKMACLAADGKLEPGAMWRQEGILGTVFEGSFQYFDENPAASAGELTGEIYDQVALAGRRIVPTITGSAYVTLEGAMIFEPADPFKLGVPE